MNIIVGFDDMLSSVGSFKTAMARVVRIAAPKTFTARDLAKLRRDCELLLDRIEKNPGKFQTLVKRGLVGDRQSVTEIVDDLKLREEDFEREGGGWIWVVIVLACCLLLSGDKEKKK